MVFQSFNLFSHLTALDNITLAPLIVKGASKDEARALGTELLRRVGPSGQGGGPTRTSSRADSSSGSRSRARSR